MGYFSNGTEGMQYEEEYCDHCIHQNQEHADGTTGCAVWAAHMVYNYEDCNKPESILHMLIPKRADHLGNEQCKLYVPLSAAAELERLGQERLF